MTAANWISLLLMLAGLAGTWGGLLARVKTVEQRSTRTADDFEKSRERQGGRIGGLEERLAHLEGAIGRSARTRTRPIPIQPPDADEET